MSQDMDKPSVHSLDNRKHENNMKEITSESSKTCDIEQDLKSKDKNLNHTLQASIAPALVIACVCGFFPVRGITSKNPQDLRYSVRSWRALYSYLVVFLALLMGFMAVLRFLRNGISLDTAGDIMFFAGNALNMMVWINLASNWKDLMVAWREVELVVPGDRRRTRLKISTMIAVITFLALFEHLSADVNTLTWILKEESLSWNTVALYFRNSFKMMFEVMPFSLPLGLLFSLVNLIDVIVWNYTDLIIVIVSIALTDLFHSVNNLFDKVNDRKSDIDDWRHLRETFTKVHGLARLLDDTISLIVLLSVGSNLYFICLQLLNSLRPMKNVSQRVYFYSSFGYLMARTLVVCLTAASIPIEAEYPLKILYDVPSSSFNIEIQRLIMQINKEEIALTGSKFFSITRSLIITILGTIVTYEIVLVQFNSLSDENANSDAAASKKIESLVY